MKAASPAHLAGYPMNESLDVWMSEPLSRTEGLLFVIAIIVAFILSLRFK